MSVAGHVGTDWRLLSGPSPISKDHALVEALAESSELLHTDCFQGGSMHEFMHTSLIISDSSF